RYLMVSKRWLADFRVQGADLIGKSHYDVFPEIPEHWKEVHRRCLQGAVERCEEEGFVRNDGAGDWTRWEVRPWYRNNGQIGGSVIYVENITQRKRDEAALLESELRLRRALKIGGMGYIDWDVQSNQISWSPETYQLFGYDPDHFSPGPGAMLAMVFPEERP